MNRALVGGASIAIVVVYALGAGRWVSTDAGWYRSLVRPPWQPPDAVFGIIWPYNFVMLGVAGWAVAARESRAEQTVWLVSLALSVATASHNWYGTSAKPSAVDARNVSTTSGTVSTVAVPSANPDAVSECGT